MNKHFASRLSLPVVVAFIAGTAVFLVLAAYGLTRLASSGEVMGRVEVASTPIGGLDEPRALTTLIPVEDRFTSRPAIFIVESKFVSLDPHEAGFDVDEQAIVDDAMTIGRDGNPISEFVWWFGHIFSTVHLPLQGSVDNEAVEEVFDQWDLEVIAQPADPGGVLLTDDGLVPVYPLTGTGIHRPPARPLVSQTLLSIELIETTIPTHVIESQLTRADVDAALAEAEEMLSGPVEMTYEGTHATFSVDDLKHAFISETVTESPVRIINRFDAEQIDETLAPLRSEFEAEPVNAEFRIRGVSVSIVPGSKGTRIDSVETAERLNVASLTEARTGQLPLVQGADPDITTEYLESLNVNHMVSSFTTFHPCCADRVTNIHQMADDVRGALVLPGQTFSLNDYVGQRTEDGGYLPAGTIVAGELTDTVGGGVSQFATTMYNAVFWGGYEDVAHKPHSYYFRRYPEGVEATVNWRTPDLQFRNNRSHAILIDTRYTDDSITVRLFGDNDGRTLTGEQSGGESKVRAAIRGGPEALHVKGEVSDRFAETDPPSPKYLANPELELDQQEITQEEGGGWSVTVTRRILRNGEDLVEEMEWVVRYAPKFAVIEVHPCMVPGTAVPCPTTTTLPPATTTFPPPTTTTLPPPTTTIP
jgi:vancomycin resistance protein YoaR